MRSLALIMFLLVAPVDAGEAFKYDVPIQQRIQVERDRRCEYKLPYYRRSVQENPDSAYYKWLLRRWEKRCLTDE